MMDFPTRAIRLLGVLKLFADQKPTKIELVLTMPDGEEVVINDEFISPLDASMVVAHQASLGWLPSNAVRFFARDAGTGEWIAEATPRKVPHAHK